MEAFQLIVLDLITDSCRSTVEHLKEVVENQQLANVWPQSLTVLCRKDETDDVSNASIIGVFLEAKDKMDSDNQSNFVLVTSSPHKAFWEKVCCCLFTPAHNWVVYGVSVTGRPLASVADVDEGQINVCLKEVLTTVGNPKMVQILRPSSIPDRKFNAGFSTRHGGVSSLTQLASLNLVYTTQKVDPVAVIEENRRRLAAMAGFDAKKAVFAKVAHGKAVRVVERGLTDGPAAGYDCLVTKTPGMTLVVPGADCCTILLADTKTGACGAVHAGWKGTVKMAPVETLKTMMMEYGTKPRDVVVAIGPCVEMDCFSLSDDDAKPLTDLEPSLTHPVEDRPGWVHVDLVRANVLMLEREGVLPQNVDTSLAMCAKCRSDLFFSHERDGFPFGNQVGFISLCVEK